MNKNKVLVLDSDFVAAESAASIFRADGMKVFRTSDGQAALEMFLVERPDAIVVSALPRDPDDFDICAAIAKDANPVPVIVLAGPNEEEAFRKGRPRPSGVAAFLAKPILPENLRAALHRVLASPEKKEVDEELERVLDVLNPVKPGSAKVPAPLSLASPKPSPLPAPVAVQDAVPPASFKPSHPSAPARVQVPAKNRQESVDSILADILADVGIDQKQKKAAFPSGETIRRSGDRNTRVETAQADSFIPEFLRSKPIKPKPNRPKPPAVVPVSIPVPAAAPVPPPPLAVSGIPPLVLRKPRPAAVEDSLFAIPKDIEKPAEFEALPSPTDNSSAGIAAKPKKKAGMKLFAMAGGLIFVASLLVFGVLGKKSPAPGLPERNSAVSDAIPASLENGGTSPDTTAPESTPGEIKKKLLASLSKPGPKETPGVAAKPPAADIKPTTPDQGAVGGLQAGEANPIPIKPGETTPPPVVAPIKVDPAVSKLVNPDQIPGLVLQTRETDSVPTKPAETTPPPVDAPVKEAPPAVTVGQLVPLDQVDVQPQLTNSVNAVYPPSMMQRKIEGQLQFSILISENGDVLKAELIPASTDNLGFESAARTALLKRKYKPAFKGGVPVQVTMPINVVFRLNR